MIYLDDDYLKVRKYETILFLDNNTIEIKLPLQLLQITGKQLQIKYFSHEEIIVTGKIGCLKLL